MRGLAWPGLSRPCLSFVALPGLVWLGPLALRADARAQINPNPTRAILERDRSKPVRAAGSAAFCGASVGILVFNR